MDYDRYTLKAQEAIQDASAEARKRDHSQVDVEHLLLALLRQEEGVVPALFERIGVDRGVVEAEAEAALAAKPKVFGEGSQLYLSPYASTAIAKAETEAAALKDEFVAAEHILLGIVSGEGEVPESLRAKGVTKEAVLSALKSVRGTRRVTDQAAE